MGQEQIRRCIFCMETLGEGSSRCPRCFKAPWDYRPQGDCLMPETELHGRYRLGAVLGAGSFGRTYIGWDTVLDKAVALKEYAPSGLCVREEDGSLLPVEEKAFFEGKAAFWKEAQTVYARFDVPGICPVLDCFEEKGTAYMVEEYMPGGTLGEMLEKRPGRRLTYEEALSLFAPVLAGLSLLHGEGIVHLDISPDNLMLDADGRLRLIDFGSAVGKNQGGKPTAKYSYAPPEQLGAGGKVGPWSDLYSLCAVLYESLGGERPAPALRRMGRETLPPLSRRAELPAEAESAIMQGLGLEVQSRFFALSPFMEKLGVQTPQKADLLKAHRVCWGEIWLDAISSPILLKKKRRGLTGLQKRRLLQGLGIVVLVLGLLSGGAALYARTHPMEWLQKRLEWAYKTPKPQRQVIAEGTELYEQIKDSLTGYAQNEYGRYEVDKAWVKETKLLSNNDSCFYLKETLGKRVLELTLEAEINWEEAQSTFYGDIYERGEYRKFFAVDTHYFNYAEWEGGTIHWETDAYTGYMQSLWLSTRDRELALKFLTKTFPCFVPETYFTQEEAEALLDTLFQEDSLYSISQHGRFYLYGSYYENSGWSIYIYPQDGLQSIYGY